MPAFQIAFNEEQLSVLAVYYREQEKATSKQLDSIRKILSKIETRIPKVVKRRGRPRKNDLFAEVLSAATGPKKRGRKPGSKVVSSKPYTGKKRGRKPKSKNTDISAVL